MERFRQASPQADIAPWPLPKNVLKNQLSGPHVPRYLVNKSLSLSTKKTYSNAFKLFNRFLGVNYGSTFANSIPVNVSCIMAFITYMFSLAYAYSSIIIYVSTISFVHKVGNWPDPANKFSSPKNADRNSKELWYSGYP